VCQKEPTGYAAARAGDMFTVEEKRAPDPMRPGAIPEGEPYAKVGRPGTAVLAVALVVAAAVGLIVYALLR
jgi:hypothetical protein